MRLSVPIYERFTVETGLTPAETRRQIDARVLSQYWIDTGGRGSPFGGPATDFNFRLHHRWSRSYLTALFGQIIPAPAGSQIIVTIWPSWVMLLVFLGVTVVPLLWFLRDLFAMLMAATFSWGIFLSPGVAVAWVVLFKVVLYKERIGAQSDLEALLAVAPQQFSGPRPPDAPKSQNPAIENLSGPTYAHPPL